ncbi:endonuclease/exonuclease/phosphatase family protein, partial [Streptomyces rubiginosohelvolus]
MNVLEKRYADWDRRRDVLARGILACRPDVVALQEVVHDQPRRSVVTDLLGEGWHVASHPRWTAEGMGAALASRWPIAELRSDDFQGVGRTATMPWCGVITAEVRAPHPFGSLLIVHHKPNWPRGHEAEREAQAVAAARLAEAMAGGRLRHVVAMGDFDAIPDSASVRFWT